MIKKREDTTLTVMRDTKRVLIDIKYNEGLRSFDAVIKVLLRKCGFMEASK